MLDHADCLEQQLAQHAPDQAMATLHLNDNVFMRSSTWARWPLGNPLLVEGWERGNDPFPRARCNRSRARSATARSDGRQKETPHGRQDLRFSPQVECHPHRVATTAAGSIGGGDRWLA